jgi:hypothetical protein
MRVLKLSMTFESGLLPSRHFLEANTTHSFYSVQYLPHIHIQSAYWYSIFVVFLKKALIFNERISIKYSSVDRIDFHDICCIIGLQYLLANTEPIGQIKTSFCAFWPCLAKLQT